MQLFKHFIDINKIILSYTIARGIKIFNSEEIYLISERENEAEDNGYYLYKYIRKNYPEKKVFYLINKKSNRYKEIKLYERIIDYNSLKHYIYYFLANKHISAFQFFGVPDSPLIWFLENKGFFKKKRIFLQHGITKEFLEFLYYDKTKYDLFICGGKPEYNFIKKYFNYPEENIIYTGFARYDGLHEYKVKKQILLMPTWRQWLGMTNKDNSLEKDSRNLLSSKYYKMYSSFLCNKKLENLLHNSGYELLFYLHPEAQRFFKYFDINSEYIKVIARSENILQDILKESEILITDYSSVGFEFGYMRKKMLYYQFDREEYYDNHFKKGYFDCEKDGFGKVAITEEELLNNLEEEIKRKTMDKIYLERAIKFFEIYDNKNSERIFEVIRKL